MNTLNIQGIKTVWRVDKNRMEKRLALLELTGYMPIAEDFIKEQSDRIAYMTYKQIERLMMDYYSDKEIEGYNYKKFQDAVKVIVEAIRGQKLRNFLYDFFDCSDYEDIIADYSDVDIIAQYFESCFDSDSIAKIYDYKEIGGYLLYLKMFITDHLLYHHAVMTDKTGKSRDEWGEEVMLNLHYDHVPIVLRHFAIESIVDLLDEIYEREE